MLSRLLFLVCKIVGLVDGLLSVKNVIVCVGLPVVSLGAECGFVEETPMWKFHSFLY